MVPVWVSTYGPPTQVHTNSASSSAARSASKLVFQSQSCLLLSLVVFRLRVSSSKLCVHCAGLGVPNCRLFDLYSVGDVFVCSFLEPWTFSPSLSTCSDNGTAVRVLRQEIVSYTSRLVLKAFLSPSHLSKHNQTFLNPSSWRAQDQLCGNGFRDAENGYCIRA